MGSHYRASDFDFEYPREAVAQHPLADRGASRMLELEKESGTVRHRRFRDFPTLLEAGDVLVVNASRVIPARLTGQRESGGDAEILLVHSEPDGTWLAMVHPGGKLKEGRTVRFGDDAVAEVVEVVGGGLRRISFSGRLSAEQIMRRHGVVPLPPYIERPAEPEDRERYQTVFADVDGSVAAPTAGLHFTAEILEELKSRGVRIAELLLHVGPGTFKPVEVDDPAKHRMHAEWYAISEAAAVEVNTALARGGRVWAVGTTVARALETAATKSQGVSWNVAPGFGWTDLFIYPPHTFKIVDALLTNFHLPRSTLLMLVAAFAGYEHTMAAYREAVARQYRLFSYGDAMAIR
ncbi:MAG: tRNA preQ1(34) S-adenosylmethionine ribosyltransferase-isomerase QueA [Gemmatimonadota bacterium]|nr:MAG: tRNA preQ1(34) S-adenosylmethionine ribosyltransferase-isomerase QueA [Gemmatimonadota bacterium]